MGTGVDHHMPGPHLTALTLTDARRRAQGHQKGRVVVALVPALTVLNADGLDPGAQLDIELAIAAGHRGPGFTDERGSQGFVVNGGVGAADADRHQLFVAQLAIAVGNPGLPVGDLFFLEQLHRWKVGREGLETFPQKAALAFTHPQHHLGGAEHAAVPALGIQQLGVMHDHFGRALDPDRLLQGVIRLDIAAVNGLAVVGGP